HVAVIELPEQLDLPLVLRREEPAQDRLLLDDRIQPALGEAAIEHPGQLGAREGSLFVGLHQWREILPHRLGPGPPPRAPVPQPILRTLPASDAWLRAAQDVWIARGSPFPCRVQLGQLDEFVAR